MASLNNKTLTLTRIHNPFNRADRDQSHYEYRGEPLSAIREVLPGDIDFIVSLNGHVVPEEHLFLVTPQPGDHVVFLPVPAGGGQGGKQVGRIVGMLAITILTIYTAGAASALYGTMLGAMAGGAVSMVGGVLVNALFAPKPPSPDTGSNAYSWAPQTLQRQGIPMPKYYGTCKVTGNIISAYTDSDGIKQRQNALISLGMGPIKGISPENIMLNTQPIGNFREVNATIRLGNLDQDAISDFDSIRTEYPQYVKVDYGTPYTYVTTGNSFDALVVEVSFPLGLYKTMDDGSHAPYSVQLKIEISAHGTNTWKSITETPDTATAVAQPAHWSLGYWTGQGGNAWIEVSAGSTNPADHTEGEWVSNRYSDRQWHWLTNGVKVVSTTADYVIVTGDSPTPLRFSYPANNLPHGKYDVRVTRMTTATASYIVTDLYLTNVREVVDVELTYPRQALVGIKALATDQLSGSFQFSAIADCALLCVWTGSEWVVDFNNNPAWVLWDVLTQPVFDNDLNPVRYDGIDPSRLDLPKFKELADWCNELVPDGDGGYEKRMTFNGGFDAEITLWDAAQAVCQTAGCSLVPNGTGYTLAIEKPVDEPVGLFGVGNIGIDSFKETFLPMEDRAAEIEVSFLDKNQGYERTTISIVNDEITTIANKVSVQAMGVSSASEANRLAARQLRVNQLITRTIQFTADIDAIACTVGDVTNIQHDVPQWGFGGRIVSATATTLQLDQEVTLEAGKPYSVMVRLSDDTIVTRAVVNVPGTSATVSVATPFPQTPQAFDIYAFGESAKVVKPFRVIAIQRSGDLEATITAVEYNESVYDDSGAPAVPTPNYSSLETLPAVLNLQMVERIYLDPTVTLANEWLVSWENPVSLSYAGAEIWADYGTGWERIREVPEPGNSLTFPVRYPGLEYCVAVATKNRGGLRQTADNAPQVVATAAGIASLPTPANAGLSVFGGGTVFAGRDCTVRWDPANLAPTIDGGYQVDILTTAGVLKRSTVVKGTTWTYTFGMNFDDFGGVPAPSFKITVTTVNLGGAPATPQTITVTNSAPVAPTALAAAGQLLAVKLTATYATPEDLDRLEVWGATVNNRGSAVLIGTTKTSEFIHTGLAASAVYYYWVRVVDRFEQPSGWYPSGSTAGKQGPAANSATEILQVLSNRITESQLAASLASTIDDSSTGIQTEQAIRAITIAPDYSATTAYPDESTVIYNNILYQNKRGVANGPEAWNSAHWTRITAKMYAQYMVKLDVNGYVSGFGMANDGSSSTFLVNADKFAVGKLGASSVLPFFVDGGVVYIDTAMIRYADINTLHLAGNAVTVPVGVFTSAAIAITNYTTSIQSGVIDSEGQPVIIIVSFISSMVVSGGSSLLGVYRDSTLVFTYDFFANWPMCFSFTDTPPTGPHTYSLRMYSTYQTPFQYNFSKRSLILLGAKR